MSEIRKFATICKISPKSDIFILILTFVLTVVFDLVVAIAVGIVLACVMFMKRMSDVTDAYGWKEIDESNDSDNVNLKVIPEGAMVYEITGPIFFGASTKIANVIKKIENQIALAFASRYFSASGHHRSLLALQIRPSSANRGSVLPSSSKSEIAARGRSIWV